MKTNEFIYRELVNTIISEISKTYSEKKSKQLAEQLAAFDIGDELENLDELPGIVSEVVDLSNLNNSKFFIQQVINVDDLEFAKADLGLIEKRLSGGDNHKLLQLLWVYQKLDMFKEDEFFETEVTDFVKILLGEYDHLLALEDFFGETGIANELLHYERVKDSCGSLLPLFKDASEKHPEIAYLKKTLGFLYYHNGNYESALGQLGSYNDELASKDQSVDEVDYLEVVEYMALCHDKLGNDEKVSECVEFVLSNLPVLHYEGQEEVMVSQNLNSFFLRMRQNIRKGNRQEVLDDYRRIKNELQWWDWANEFADVLQFVEEK